MGTADDVIAGFDFASLLEGDTHLRRVGRYLIGPCPMCGGVDRFQAKQTGGGEYIWICRKCSPGKYHDAIDYVMARNHFNFMQALEWMRSGSTYPISEEERQHIRRNNELEAARRQAEIDARLADLSTQEIWEALHRRLGEDNRAWWRQQGVPNEWQDYLSLGYTPDKAYYDTGKTLCHSPAYTIPYFHYDTSCENCRRFVTMQYRLVEAPDPNDRYRFEHGIGSSFYMATPTQPIDDKVIVCEGAKKAIVARVWSGIKDVSFLAVPSKSDSAGVVDAVKGSGRVWVMLDPDARFSAYMLASQIGKSARVVEMPFKLDDALVIGYLKKGSLDRYLRQGVKVC